MGLAALGLGVLAHVLAGGALPSVLILLALGALTVLASTLTAQAGLPPWAVLLVLGVAQQVLHWILGGLGGVPTSLSVDGDHHGEEVPVVGTAASQGHSPEVMLMLHAHLGAALLIGWALNRYPTLAGWVLRRRGQRWQTREGAPAE